VGGGADAPGLAAGVDAMHRACVLPAFASAAAAAAALRPGGAVVLTGSAAATAPTPGMLAYGAAKAATHHLAASLAAPGSGLPPGAFVAALAPRVIDTPSNRQWMAGPGVDTSTWTPPGAIAAQCVAWAEGAGRDRMPSGSVVTATTTPAGTTF
jgi:dihydropteridine reductase